VGARPRQCDRPELRPGEQFRHAQRRGLDRRRRTGFTVAPPHITRVAFGLPIPIDSDRSPLAQLVATAHTDDAVYYPHKHVGDGPFALLLEDTIFENGTPCTETLISHAEAHGSSVLSLERVPWEEVSKYGVADLGAETDGPCFPVGDFVEKPPREEAPSNLAITGRYVFTADIFDRLEETDLGVGRGLQLTDAIRKLDAVRGSNCRGIATTSATS
jgi:NDP-sugar pyrophosphorylase family protein